MHLALANFSACTIGRDGSVWCWGAYARDRLSTVPVQVSGCSDSAWSPPDPGKAFPVPAASNMERAIQANQARAEAHCHCVSAGSSPDCVELNSTMPDATCLRALAWENDYFFGCTADAAWSEAETLCGPGDPVIAESPLLCEPSNWGAIDYCHGRTAPCERNCEPHQTQFECADGELVPLSTLCNSQPDCADETDQQGCL